MVSVGVTALLYGLMFACFMQPDRARFLSAAAFTGVTLSHEVFFASLDGFAYYASAALADLVIIGGLSLIRPINNTGITLIKISMLSILVNGAGWVLWFWYFPPHLYDSAYVLLYAWALITLITAGGLHVGRNTFFGGSSGFHRASTTSARHISRNGGKK